jgi:hypothetical protein
VQARPAAGSLPSLLALALLLVAAVGIAGCSGSGPDATASGKASTSRAAFFGSSAPASPGATQGPSASAGPTAGATAGATASGATSGPSAVPATRFQLNGTVGPVGVYHDADQKATGLEPRAVGGAFHTGLDSTEPTVGVDSKGRIYVGAYTQVAVSEDRGQTFRAIAGNVAGISTHDISGDPYLWVDATTDRLYQMDINPQSVFISLSWTDDVGKTWTNNPSASGNPSADDHPTMVTAKPRLFPTVGYPNVVHACFNDAVYTACTASLDGGLTFRPQVVLYTIAEPQYCNGLTGISNGQTGHLRADKDGRVYLPTARCFATGTGYPVVAISDNDGITWTTHPIARDDADLADDHDVDVAIDPQGHLYASWNSKGRILLASSSDGGATWTAPVNITAPGVTGTTFNAIGALADGRVAVAYLGTTIPGGYDGKTDPTGGLVGDVTGEPDPPEWAPAVWNGYLTIVDQADTAHPHMLSLTGNPADDPLARGLCGRSRCHGMNDFIDLTVDGDGRPWASFVDVCTKACVTDPSVHYDTAEGVALTLLKGPGRDLASSLPPLAPQASASS